MATLGEDGVPLHKLNGVTYRADELTMHDSGWYYEIRRKSDGVVVETSTAKLEGVA